MMHSGVISTAGLLKKGQKNVIAVRVLDTGGAGGIYEGPVGIISQQSISNTGEN